MLLFLDNLCVLFGERFGVFGGLLQEVTKMPTLLITGVMMIITPVDHSAQKIQPVCFPFMVRLANANESAIHTFSSSKRIKSHRSKSFPKNVFTRSSGDCPAANPGVPPPVYQSDGSQF